jgi:hypothetical protein
VACEDSKGPVESYTRRLEISVTGYSMMREFRLRLVAPLCPDGVKLVHLETYPDVIAFGYGPSGPDWFVYCSDRMQQRTTIRDVVDLEDALVVRFVNATDDVKLIRFLSRFGLPEDLFRYVGIGGGEPRNIVLGRQRVLRGLLEDAGSGDAARALKAGNTSLHRVGRDDPSLEPGGRMVRTMQNLMDFMYMEVAAAAAIGVRLASCKRCGDLFLTGPLTTRRATATYCGDRCRVGAHRAKRNSKGG